MTSGRKERDLEWAREYARQICDERGWPMEEPVRLHRTLFRRHYVIWTNADSIGQNAIIETDSQRRLISAGLTQDNA